jgi:hypothetical protein
VAATLSFAAAFLSYRFVETPLRKPWTDGQDKFAVPAGIASAALLLMILPANVWAQNGWNWRLSKDAQAITKEMAADGMKLKCRKKAVDDYRGACLFDAKGNRPTVAVIGDSHSSRLALGLQKAFEDQNDVAMLARFPGIVPFPSVNTFVGTERRNTPIDRGFAALEAIEPELIFVHARFELYWWTDEGADFGNPSRSVGLEGPPASVEESQANFIQGMEETFDRLDKMQGKVVIVGAIPFPGVDMQQCVQRPTYIASAQDLISNCGGLTKEESVRRAEAVNEKLRAAAEARNFEFVDPLEVFCTNEGRYCLRVFDGKFVYEDNNHLNGVGGTLLANFILKQISEKSAL